MQSPGSKQAAAVQLNSTRFIVLHFLMWFTANISETLGSGWSQWMDGGSFMLAWAFSYTACKIEPIPGVTWLFPVPPSIVTVYYHRTLIPCRGKMLLLSAKYCAAFSPAGGKKALLIAVVFHTGTTSIPLSPALKHLQNRQGE